MSVRHALLALLAIEPASTYQLRKEFDDSTGSTWPLNIGQVATTLQRLERDELVTREADEGDDAPPQWRLTSAGKEELDAWWATPVSRLAPERDELVIKLAVAISVPGVDVPALIQRQRAASLGALHDITRNRRDVEPDDLMGMLLLDSHIFRTEAELRWLDEVEGALIAASQSPRRRRTTPAPVDATDPADTTESATEVRR